MLGNAEPINNVIAAPIAASGGGSAWATLLPLVLIFAAFYFFMIKPQRNKQRKQLQMLSALEPGKRIMTSAGLYGTITAVDDDGVTIEIAPGVECRYVKQAIMQVLEDDDADETDDEDETDDTVQDTEDASEAKDENAGDETDDEQVKAKSGKKSSA